MTEQRNDEPQTARMLIPPAVRQRASELGIPIATIEGLQGSGPQGRLRVADLEHIARAPTPPLRSPSDRAASATPVVTTSGSDVTAGAVTIPLDSRRLIRARRAMEDAITAADLTSAIEVDLSTMVAAVEARTGQGPGTDRFADHFLTLLAHAAFVTLEMHPMLNARIDMEVDGGQTTLRAAVDLSLMMSGDRGDVRAVIAGANALHLDELHNRIRTSGMLARAGIGRALGSDQADENEGGTFAIIDRRSRPPLFETPPLPSGCSGALAVGMLEKRPLVDAATGELRIAWAAYLCMTYDHRLIDGADAARFLGALAAELGTDWSWPAGR